MITYDDVGRPVWANDAPGQLVRLTLIPDDKGGHYESAVVLFDGGNEQVFPAHKVVLREKHDA